jgi:hypothetical protein
MAPQVGLEPTTLRLTAGCSAIELLRSVCALQAAPQIVTVLYRRRRIASKGREAVPMPISGVAAIALVCAFSVAGEAGAESKQTRPTSAICRETLLQIHAHSSGRAEDLEGVVVSTSCSFSESLALATKMPELSNSRSAILVLDRSAGVRAASDLAVRAPRRLKIFWGPFPKSGVGVK